MGLSLCCETGDESGMQGRKRSGLRRGANPYIFVSEDKKHERRVSFFRAVLVLLALLVVAVLVANFTISYRVTLENLRLTVLNLPDDLENYSILHISDLHGAVYGDHQKAIRTALGDTRYSCVVMTGDMLGENGEVDPLLDLIALIPAETPKYFIPGDLDGPATDPTAHGSLSIYHEWADVLQQAGVTLLDRPVLVTRGKGRIWFVPESLYALDLDGMLTVYTRQLQEMYDRATTLTADDAARMRVLEYEISRLTETQELKKQFEPTDIQIVLTHVPLSPEYVADQVSWSGKEDYFSLRYASLILAGHYNGGQWRLPFVGAIYVPELGWFPPDELVRGLDYPAGIPQHISPGLGSDPHYEHQPGRLFNAPQITRIILTRRAT